MIVGPVPEGRDPDAYDRLRRRVLWSLPTGLYVMGSCAGAGADRRQNLMTVSLVTQVCMEPKLVGAAVDVTAVTCGLVREGGSFSLCLLRRTDRAVVRRFVKPVETGAVVRDPAGHATAMAGEAVSELASGVPVLRASAAWLECAVRQELVLGSHVLFVGEVVDVSGPDADGADALEVLRMEDTRMNYGG
jgi:flavin reductase (DIM6/NTAB) family NADH-FMN oxidoreductase RutF